MLLVGITGNIGSGKTTVCQIFETLGVKIYYADQRAKWLLEHHPLLIQQVKNLLGEEAYYNHSLNKNYIAEKVFQDSILLEKYNKIVHPKVWDDTLTWLQANKYEKYLIKEAALLVESGSYQQLDKLIVVTAPKNIRIQRVMQRDNLSEKQVLDRMKNQLPESEKLKHADFQIINDGHHDLIQQVHDLHQQLLLEIY